MKKVSFGAFLAAALLGMAAGASALTAAGPETESGRKWAESAFFPRVSALTGIEVTGQEQASGTWAKTLTRLEAGQADADILFKAGLTRSEEKRLLDSGSIIDLSGLIEENMPNLSALLEKHPEWKADMTLADGRIASLPALNEEAREVCVWINGSWLEKLGLSVPQSVGELTAALQAFRTGDPNENGQQDERAVDMTGVWELRWLLPYFGIAADDWNLTRLADGTLGFAPEQDGYYAFIETLSDWYASGILDGKTFTGMHAEATLNAASSSSSSSEEEKAASGILVSLSPVSHVPVGSVMEYSALLMPANGTTVWRDMPGGFSTGALAVTSACADPAAALRWADALYGEEAMILAYAGEEGTEWQRNAEGCWNYKTDDLSIEDIRDGAIMYTGTEMPGLVPSSFLNQVDSEEDRRIFAESERVRAVSTAVTVPYLFSGEAAEKAASLQRTLCRMVDEGIARFATGEIPLTQESYAAFLSELKAAGSDELVSLANAAEASR